jgi:hypothetical protein
MNRYITRGIILLAVGLVSGCMTTNTPTPEDTKLYKTWSNAFLVEMGNAIVNHDFETYVYYMSEYEDALKEENQRTLQFLQEGEDLTRYGDPEHQYYMETTMKMCAGDYATAYFYLTRYIKVMENRFMYNQDWKPIPDYAK